LEASVITPKLGRTAVLMAEADIERSPEQVFDYCSDPANEPEWNIKMKAIDSLLQPFSSFLDVSRSFAGRMRDDAVWGLPAKT
jgi:uncharacterized protein YndB with AHSA1/START domain